MTALGVIRLLLLCVLLPVCLLCWAIAVPLGRGPFWVQFFLGRVGYILGLRVRCENEAVRRHVLYIANHISWLDILALGGATRTRFIAKSEIAGWKLVGWLASIADTVFVSRDRRTETRAQANQVSEALRGDRPVTLFGEGGTGDGITLRPFRAPLFAAAIEAGALVQPVAIDYGPDRARFAWFGTSFSHEMMRLLNRNERIPVTLRFLEPLDASLLDRKQLAAQSHAEIAAALR